MFRILFASYPFASERQSLLSALLAGLLAFFVLSALQPWGIYDWETSHKLLKLSGYGAITCIITLLYRKVLSVAVTEEAWVIWKEWSAILLLIICIALGNIGYTMWMLGAHSLSWHSAGAFLVATLLISCVPVSAAIFLGYNRWLNLHQKGADELNIAISQNNVPALKESEAIATRPETTLSPLRLCAENNNDSITLLPSAILFVKSADNYCSIVYTEDGVCNKKLLRTSLSRLNAQTSPYQPYTMP